MKKIAHDTFFPEIFWRHRKWQVLIGYFEQSVPSLY